MLNRVFYFLFGRFQPVLVKNWLIFLIYNLIYKLDKIFYLFFDTDELCCSESSMLK